jgi:predicted TIM-barrel fold metal-dependent hydrolase
MAEFTRREQMRREVLEGRPVTAFEIIDCHGHLGYWSAFSMPWRTAQDMVNVMDVMGVRCIVASAHSGISADYKLGNDQIIQAMREQPGRILGYCSVNPNFPIAETERELERCFHAGMTAIKLHPGMHRQRADSEGYRPAWEFAHEHGLTVLSHSGATDGFCGIRIFEGPARDYPNAKVLLGHAGFGYEGAGLACDLARKYPNVYLDITISIAYRGLIERMVKGAGADRVLYGTDLPFMDPRPMAGRLAFSDLDDRQLELVLGGNARKIFGV